MFISVLLSDFCMFKISVVLMPETHLEGLSFYHASLSLTAHQFLATLFATNYQSTCLSLCNNNLPYMVYIPINWEIHILSYLAYNKAVGCNKKFRFGLSSRHGKKDTEDEVVSISNRLIIITHRSFN